VTSRGTNVISNNATVVLLIPVAVDVATQLGAYAFAFVLAVTFATSTSFLSPISYQTNLMVYEPGGYEFTDFLCVGGRSNSSWRSSRRSALPSSGACDSRWSPDTSLRSEAIRDDSVVVSIVTPEQCRK
jgi:hypothetical protein